MSELSELSAEAKSLVEQGRDADGPSASDRQRVRSRLAAELGAGAFVVAAAATTLPSALPAAGAGAPTLVAPGALLRSLWTHGLVKAAAAASAVVALYLGALTLVPSTPHPEARTSETAARVTATDEQPAVPAPGSAASTSSPQPNALAPAASVGEVAEPKALLPARPPHAARAKAGAARTASEPAPGDVRARTAPSTLGAELALLAAAQRALREHQPQRALELAQQHAVGFASGSLGEERRGIEALAHCQLGEPGHASVASFLAHAPGSPLAARVRKECGPR